MIIIADDSPLMRRVFSAKLSKLGGVELHFTSSGMGAFELVQSLRRVDAVVLDYHMEGSTGLEGNKCVCIFFLCIQFPFSFFFFWFF